MPHGALIHSLNPNWYAAIVPGLDFQCKFDDCNDVMLFAVSSVGQEWAFSLYE